MIGLGKALRVIEEFVGGQNVGTKDAEGIPITSMPLSPSDLFALRRTRETES